MRHGPALLLALALCGCASSGARLIDSYRAPGTVSVVLKRGAILVMNGGPERRALLEAEVVAGGDTSRVFAAHSVLDAEAMRSVPAIRQNLLDKGFDGIVTLRLVRADEINPEESVRGESFTTYASSVAPGEPAFGEGNLRAEVGIYELESQKLIWQGIVELHGITDPRVAARETARVVRQHLHDYGLLHN